MTVHDLLNGVIYTGVLAGALTGIGTFLHFAVVRPMRGFLRHEVSEILVEIKDAVEKNTDATESLQQKLEDHIANGGHHHPEHKEAP